MRNPYELWESVHVQDEKDLKQMITRFHADNPLTGGFDTETTGLHIIKDKPFLIQFGWLVPRHDFGRVFTFYPTPENMDVFFQLAKKLKYMVAHNLKYDLHMLSNIGYAAEVQAMTNLVENMAVARLALEAIPSREGGDSLKLKELGKTYVHPDATKSESIIKDELRKLKAEGIKVLTAALKQFNHTEDMEYKVFRKDTGAKTTSSYKGEVEWKWVPAKWNKKRIETWMKDPTLDIELLPDEIRDVWEAWQEEYPEPTYEDVDRDVMIRYGGEDIITMLEFFNYAFPFVEKREQLPILEMESKCILPLYRMERIGLKADLTYLDQSRKKVKAYITKLRKDMHEIVGEKITVGQHQRIKDIFHEKFGIVLESDDSKNMSNIMKEHEGQAHRLAERIKSLRSLEKWYSTYILPIIKNAQYDGNVYTQINGSGAVSGRMSSNFQQFPKSALFTLEGEELFHPRKAFTVKGGKYESTVYIDYDQIELVCQAHYTLLVTGGDLNLCRAFMPFRCRHFSEKRVYDYKNPRDRERWDEKQPNGESAWLDEQGKPWSRTDLHSATTHKAYPHIPMDSTEFKKVYRPKGKMTNFAANYGASPKALVESLGISWEEAETLINGYNEAFPGIIAYQKAIIKAHHKKGYVHNHYGRRYYLSDSSRAYTLGNHVVQGSCADALKKAIIELDEFLLDKQSNIVIPIHDEVAFDICKGEEWVIPKLRDIMQQVFSWCLVPVTAGVDITKTRWAEKEEMN